MHDHALRKWGYKYVMQIVLFIIFNCGCVWVLLLVWPGVHCPGHSTAGVSSTKGWVRCKRPVINIDFSICPYMVDNLLMLVYLMVLVWMRSHFEIDLMRSVVCGCMKCAIASFVCVRLDVQANGGRSVIVIWLGSYSSSKELVITGR